MPPSIPKNTCPNIDDVIARVEKASIQYGKLQDAMDDLEDVESIMEELRDANASLRDNYEYQAERADKLQNDIEAADARIKELEARIDILAPASQAPTVPDATAIAGPVPTVAQAGDGQ